MNRFYLLFAAVIVVLSCAKIDDTWVMRAGDISIRPDKFKERFRRSIQYRDQDQFSEDELLDFCERVLKDDLLFTAEGYALGINREDELKEAVEFSIRRYLGRKDGPLFQRVITATDSAEIHNQVAAYVRTLRAKYNFTIHPQGQALFLKLCDTPRAKVREILYDSTYAPNPNRTPLVSFTGSSFTVADLIKNYSREFLHAKRKIKTPENVEYYLLNWFMPDLLELEAKDLNLYDEPEFQREIADMEQNLIRGECKKRLTARHIQIKPEEVDARYEQEKEKYQGKSEARAKTEIRMRMRNEKQAQRTNETLAKLSAKFKVEYNTPLLKELARELTREKQDQNNDPKKED